MGNQNKSKQGNRNKIAKWKKWLLGLGCVCALPFAVSYLGSSIPEAWEWVREKFKGNSKGPEAKGEVA